MNSGGKRNGNYLIKEAFLSAWNWLFGLGGEKNK